MTDEMKYPGDLPVCLGLTMDEVRVRVGAWSQKYNEFGYQEFVQGREEAPAAPAFQHLGLQPTAAEYFFEFGRLTQVRIFHANHNAVEIRKLLLQRLSAEQAREDAWDVDDLRVSLFPSPERGATVVYLPLPTHTRKAASKPV